MSDINFPADVSVVIPFYKNKLWLKDALHSVEQQTFLPSEVIIVCDGSDEDVSEFTSKLFSVRILFQSNQGAAMARNNGMRLATGKYIAFLDSDDVWHPQKLEIQIHELEQSGLLWSYTRYTEFRDGNSRKLSGKKNDYLARKINLYPDLLNSCDIATPTVVVNSKVVSNEEMVFNSRLKFGEDYSLWIELARKFPVLKINFPLSFVRVHGNNASRSIAIQLNARKNIWEYISTFKDIPKMTIIAYKLCVLGNKVTSIFSGAGKYKKIEKITSFIAYLIPWSIFCCLKNIGLLKVKYSQHVTR